MMKGIEWINLIPSIFPKSRKPEVLGEWMIVEKSNCNSGTDPRIGTAESCRTEHMPRGSLQLLT